MPTAFLPEHTKPSRSKELVHYLVLGLVFYYGTSLIVVLGVIFGQTFLRPPGGGFAPPPKLVTCFTRWDGQMYKNVAEHGYAYDPNSASTIAYFPAYPLLTRFLVSLTGWDFEPVLLLISHLFLAGSFILLGAYAGQRYPNESRKFVGLVLLAFGLFPPTFFFRMAYSEALFLFSTLLALYAMKGAWPLWLVALIVGLVTTTRPVGIALVPVFGIHLWSRSASSRQLILQSLILLPVACWGLIAFMAYQKWTFDTALAFAQTQDNYRTVPQAPWVDKLAALARLEPLWGEFSPSSGRFWTSLEYHKDPLFSLTLANPICFILVTALVILGAFRRWLTVGEVVLSFGLLMIPYVTRGYDNSMLSMSRFTAAVVPLYLVLGKLLSRLPGPTTNLILGLASFFLGTYSALFSAGYFLI